MDREFLQARIDSAKARVVALEDAVEALTVRGMASYTLDTSQTRQTVTQLDVEKLERLIESLLNRIATLNARLYGCGSVIGGPGW